MKKGGGAGIFRKGEMMTKKSQRLEDGTMLPLKMEEGATNQEMQVASKSWKRLGPLDGSVG